MISSEFLMACVVGSTLIYLPFYFSGTLNSLSISAFRCINYLRFCSSIILPGLTEPPLCSSSSKWPEGFLWWGGLTADLLWLILLVTVSCQYFSSFLRVGDTSFLASSSCLDWLIVSLRRAESTSRVVHSCVFIRNFLPSNRRCAGHPIPKSLREFLRRCTACHHKSSLYGRFALPALTPLCPRPVCSACC